MFYLEIFLLCLSWVQPWDGQQCAVSLSLFFFLFEEKMVFFFSSENKNLFKNFNSLNLFWLPFMEEPVQSNLGKYR